MSYRISSAYFAPPRQPADGRRAKARSRPSRRQVLYFAAQRRTFGLWRPTRQLSASIEMLVPPIQVNSVAGITMMTAPSRDVRACQATVERPPPTVAGSAPLWSAVRRGVETRQPGGSHAHRRPRCVQPVRLACRGDGRRRYRRHSPPRTGRQRVASKSAQSRPGRREPGGRCQRPQCLLGLVVDLAKSRWSTAPPSLFGGCASATGHSGQPSTRRSAILSVVRCMARYPDDQALQAPRRFLLPCLRRWPRRVLTGAPSEQHEAADPADQLVAELQPVPVQPLVLCTPH